MISPCRPNARAIFTILLNILPVQIANLPPRAIYSHIVSFVKSLTTPLLGSNVSS